MYKVFWSQWVSCQSALHATIHGLSQILHFPENPRCKELGRAEPELKMCALALFSGK